MDNCNSKIPVRILFFVIMLILGQMCWLGAPNKSLTPGNCFNDGSLSWNGFIASQLSKLVCGCLHLVCSKREMIFNHGLPEPQNYIHDAVCFIAKVQVKKEELHFYQFFLVPGKVLKKCLSSWFKFGKIRNEMIKILVILLKYYMRFWIFPEFSNW